MYNKLILKDITINSSATTYSAGDAVGTTQSFDLGGAVSGTIRSITIINKASDVQPGIDLLFFSKPIPAQTDDSAVSLTATAMESFLGVAILSATYARDLGSFSGGVYGNSQVEFPFLPMFAENDDGKIYVQAMVPAGGSLVALANAFKIRFCIDVI